MTCAPPLECGADVRHRRLAAIDVEQRGLDGTSRPCRASARRCARRARRSRRCRLPLRRIQIERLPASTSRSPGRVSMPPGSMTMSRGVEMPPREVRRSAARREGGRIAARRCRIRSGHVSSGGSRSRSRLSPAGCSPGLAKTQAQVTVHAEVIAGNDQHALLFAQPVDQLVELIAWS